MTIRSSHVAIGNSKGFTLFELVVTLTVLAIMVMGTVPLAQNAVKRQKELQLRATLRDVRNAIDEFKRDTIGSCPQGSVTSSNPAAGRIPGQNSFSADPRSRVVIDDCTIFDSSNLDRYPPTLDNLVDGVKVKARTPNVKGGSGLKDGEQQATEINEAKEIIKHYLREKPVDPITGKDDSWEFRSSYQAADEESWDSINVFDVRSGADGESLSGEKYSDW
ncbi:MAG: type II secretion system protein [Pyrinomonadaceae bacterium]